MNKSLDALKKTAGLRRKLGL